MLVRRLILQHSPYQLLIISGERSLLQISSGTMFILLLDVNLMLLLIEYSSDELAGLYELFRMNFKVVLHGLDIVKIFETWSFCLMCV